MGDGSVGGTGHALIVTIITLTITRISTFIFMTNFSIASCC